MSYTPVGDTAFLIDPRLNVEFDAKSVWKVIDIAMNCTADFTQRPTMADVVEQLKEAVALEASQGSSQDLVTVQVRPYHLQ